MGLYPHAALASQLVISDDGWKAIEQREGLRLKAYPDSGGIWTIGYGRAYGVYPGDVITAQQADHFLRIDGHAAELAVQRDVTIVLEQWQFDALASFAFNVGVGAFARSDVLRWINLGDSARALSALSGWCKIKGVYNQGLANRRKSEAEQFLGQMYQ